MTKKEDKTHSRPMQRDTKGKETLDSERKKTKKSMCTVSVKAQTSQVTSASPHLPLSEQPGWEVEPDRLAPARDLALRKAASQFTTNV